ncbi:unnamed protein product [Pleuronectes platessa]|uniref:Uncharacterized protein n=1 Tax=Pleuronectes platessa TaxID=8262 RepID=A0A9N7Z0U2_PLEPL|nr:unnamed protein product [Pleuronectes platessa]
MAHKGVRADSSKVALSPPWQPGGGIKFIYRACLGLSQHRDLQAKFSLSARADARTPFRRTTGPGLSSTSRELDSPRPLTAEKMKGNQVVTECLRLVVIADRLILWCQT